MIELILRRLDTQETWIAAFNFAPIRDAEGKLVAGLSISAPADRHKAGWAEAVSKAAAQTGAALGYHAES